MGLAEYGLGGSTSSKGRPGALLGIWSVFFLNHAILEERERCG